MAGKHRAVQSRKFGPEHPVREQQTGDGKAGAECLRSDSPARLPSETGKPKDYRLFRSVRPGSGVSFWVHFCREKKKKL